MCPVGGAYVPATPRGGVPLPGLAASREDTQYCWADRLNKQNLKWREGRSPCERPRTYDKFYQKTPGNFQALVSYLLLRLVPRGGFIL